MIRQTFAAFGSALAASLGKNGRRCFAIAALALLVACEDNSEKSPRYDFYNDQAHSADSVAVSLVQTRDDVKALLKESPNGNLFARSDMERSVDAGGVPFCPLEVYVFFNPYGSANHEDTDDDEFPVWRVDVSASRVQRLKTISQELRDLVSKPTPAAGTEEDRIPLCPDGKPPVFLGPSDMPSNDDGDD